MRFRSRTTTALLAGAVSLSLVAAGEPANPVGTASTSLAAVQLAVTGVDGLPAVRVLDLGTFASTDLDTTRNALGRPFASISLSPLTIGEDVIGGISHDSDTGGSIATQVAEWADPTGSMSASLAPAAVEAVADASRAVAGLAGATARLDALGLVGLDVDVTGVGTSVDAVRAVAGQGLTVSGLSVDLGDLLDDDLLAALPLGVLLDLLAQVPVAVAPDVQALIDAALSAQDAVDGVVAGVQATGAQIEAAVTALSSATADLASAEAVLDAAQAQAAAADAAVPALQAAADDAAAVVAGLQADLAGLPGNLLALIAEYPTCGTDIAGMTSCLNASLAGAIAAAADANAALATAAQDAIDAAAAVADALVAVEAAQVLVDALTDAISTLVDTLTGLIDDLLALLGDLIDAALSLDGSIDDILAALTDAPLIDVGAIDIGLSAIAGDGVDASSTTIVCAPVELSVLGSAVGTGSCDAPLTQVSSVVATAVGSLNTLLGALPVLESVVPSVELELFPTVTESITKDGAYTNAAVHVDALHLAVPSVTIDPAALVDDVLGTLDVDLAALLASVLPDTAELDALGLGAVTGAVDGVTAQLPSLADLQAQLDDAIDGLLGALPIGPLTTVGFALDVDPAAAASFAPGAAAPGAPTPAAPTLPATGGGFALLGLLALGGASLARRRR